MPEITTSTFLEPYIHLEKNNANSKPTDLLNFEKTPYGNNILCYNFTTQTTNEVPIKNTALPRRAGNSIMILSDKLVLDNGQVVVKYNKGNTSKIAKDIDNNMKYIRKVKNKILVNKKVKETTNEKETSTDEQKRKNRKMKPIPSNELHCEEIKKSQTKLKGTKTTNSSETSKNCGNETKNGRIKIISNVEGKNSSKTRLNKNNSKIIKRKTRRNKKNKSDRPKVLPGGDNLLNSTQSRESLNRTDTTDQTETPKTPSKHEIINKIQNTLKDVTTKVITMSQKYMPIVEKKTKPEESESVLVAETKEGQIEMLKPKNQKNSVKRSISKVILAKSLQNSLMILKKLKEATASIDKNKPEDLPKKPSNILQKELMEITTDGSKSAIHKLKNKTYHKNKKNFPVCESTQIVKLRKVRTEKNDNEKTKISLKSSSIRNNLNTTKSTISRMTRNAIKRGNALRNHIQVKTITPSPDLQQTSKKLMTKDSRPTSPIKIPGHNFQFTLDDFPPLQSEYPRRDTQMHASVENTFLFKLVSGNYDKINLFEPSINCTDSECSECKSRTSSEKREESEDGPIKKPLNSELGIRRGGKKFNFRKYIHDLHNKRNNTFGIRIYQTYPVNVHCNVKYEKKNQPEPPRQVKSMSPTRKNVKKLDNSITRSVEQTMIRTLNQKRKNIKVKKNETNTQKKIELTAKDEETFQKQYSSVNDVSPDSSSERKVTPPGDKKELQKYIEVVEDKFLKTFSLPEREKASAYQVLEQEIKTMLTVLQTNPNDANIKIPDSIDRISKSTHKIRKEQTPLTHENMREIKKMLTETKSASDKKKTISYPQPTATEQNSYVNNIKQIFSQLSLQNQQETVSNEQVNSKLISNEKCKIVSSESETESDPDYETECEEIIQLNGERKFIKYIHKTQIEHSSDINLLVSKYDMSKRFETLKHFEPLNVCGDPNANYKKKSNTAYLDTISEKSSLDDLALPSLNSTIGTLEANYIEDLMPCVQSADSIKLNRPSTSYGNDHTSFSDLIVNRPGSSYRKEQTAKNLTSIASTVTDTIHNINNDVSNSSFKPLKDEDDELQIDISFVETIDTEHDETPSYRSLSSRMIEFLDILTSISFEAVPQNPLPITYYKTIQMISQPSHNITYYQTVNYYHSTYYLTNYEDIVIKLQKSTRDLDELIRNTPKRNYRLMSFKDPRLRKYTSLPEFDLTEEIFMRHLNPEAKSLDTIIAHQNRLNSIYHTMVVNLQLLHHKPSRSTVPANVRGVRRRVRMKGFTQVGRRKRVVLVQDTSTAMERPSRQTTYRILLITLYIVVFVIVFLCLVLNFYCE